MMRSVLLCLLLLLPMGARALPDMPALMLLTGEIASGEGLLPTSPRDRDRILAFSVSSGQLVGSGVVGERSYVIVLSRTASFNGTQVVLELQQGRKRFALLQRDGNPAALRFAGRTLPERTVLPLRVGAQTAELTASEAAEPQAQRLSLRADLPCSVDADVNQDGACDEADLRILRLYGGGVTRTVGQP